MKLKLRKVGGSTGAIFPRELLRTLHAKEGDEIVAVETTDGIMLKAYDPELVEQIKVASETMRTEKNVLRALSET